MGNRANVCVKSKDDGNVFFYTHWQGESLAEIMSKGLSRGESRWNDPPYIRRILFCELVKDDIDGLTGYGISGTIGDNNINRPIIVIDTDKQTVGLAKEKTPTRTYYRVSFKDFASNYKVLPYD